MSLKYFNIRSGETRVAETEPQIAALWSSSDRSPNITQGQDFGWRLAPEVVIEMEQIQQDYALLEKIAVKYKMAVDDVNETIVLQYISDKTAPDTAPVANRSDYKDQYEAEVRKLKHGEDASEATELSDEELEAEMARRKAAKAQTTTTTTKKPA